MTPFFIFLTWQIGGMIVGIYMVETDPYTKHDPFMVKLFIVLLFPWVTAYDMIQTLFQYLRSKI